jgi:DNA-directed RNA polymerase sigma subunit (sigma70/sigma32)
MDEAGLAELLATLFERQTRTDRMARALWLHYVEGQTHREIGEELGVTRGRVGQMISRAVSGLRRSKAGNRERRDRILVACPPPVLDAVYGGDHWREWYGVTAGE